MVVLKLLKHRQHPIENLWKELNRRIRHIAGSSKTNLRNRLTEKWSNIMVVYTSNIIMNMLVCLQSVLGIETL